MTSAIPDVSLLNLVAHEMRAPITIFKGYLSMLRGGLCCHFAFVATWNQALSGTSACGCRAQNSLSRFLEMTNPLSRSVRECGSAGA